MSASQRAEKSRLMAAFRALSLSPSADVGDVSLQARQHARDFDEAYTDYIDGLDELPSQAQLQALQSVDSALLAMLDDDSGSLWSAEAIEVDPRWSALRTTAGEILSQFGSPSGGR